MTPIEQLEAMSNDQLKAFAEQAEADTIQAATFDKDSDWHASCFAALHLACVEMSARGLHVTGGTKQ